MMPLAIRDGYVGGELQENRLIILEQVDIDTTILSLEDDSPVDRIVLMLNRVQCQVSSSFTRCVKLDPETDRKLRAGQLKWYNKRSAGGLALICEVHVIVNGDLLATILSSEVERTLAIEVIGQVNACCSGWAITNSTVVNVNITVDTSVAGWTQALVALTLVHTSGTIQASSSSTGIILILTANTSVIFGA